MCSHPEHRVEVLPDGQIDETHVLSDEEIRIPWGLYLYELKAIRTNWTTTNAEEVPNG
jgi:hypothetical protein